MKKLIQAKKNYDNEKDATVNKFSKPLQEAEVLNFMIANYKITCID